MSGVIGNKTITLDFTEHVTWECYLLIQTLPEFESNLVEFPVHVNWSEDTERYANYSSVTATEL